MKKKLITTLTIACVCLGMFMLGGYFVTKNDTVFGAIAGANLFTSPENTSFVCGPTSQVAVATSSLASRVYTALTNSGSSNIFISLGDSASTTKGIQLNAGGGSYEILPENAFTGAIHCAALASSTLLIVNK